MKKRIMPSKVLKQALKCVDYISPWNTKYDDHQQNQHFLPSYRKQIFNNYLIKLPQGYQARNQSEQHQFVNRNSKIISQNIKYNNNTINSIENNVDKNGNEKKIKQQFLITQINNEMKNPPRRLKLVRKDSGRLSKALNYTSQCTFLNRNKKIRQGTPNAITKIVDLNDTLLFNTNTKNNRSFSGKKLGFRRQVKDKDNKNKSNQKFIREVYGKYNQNKQKQNQLITLMKIKMSKLNRTQKSISLQKYKHRPKTSQIYSKYKSSNQSKKRLKTASTNLHTEL